MVAATVVLSICVPTYNRAFVIEKTLDMLLQFTEKHRNIGDVEIIVADNFSTDNTKSLLATYTSQPNFRTFSNSKNLGITGNLINCLEQATGQFVWFFGDDDVVQLDLVDVIVEASKRKEYSFLLIPYSDFFDSCGFELSPIHAEFHAVTPRILKNGFVKRYDRYLGFVTSCIFESAILRNKLAELGDNFSLNDYSIKLWSYLFLIEESAAVLSGAVVHKRCTYGSHFIGSPSAVLKTFVYDVFEIGRIIQERDPIIGQQFLRHNFVDFRFFLSLRQRGGNLRKAVSDLKALGAGPEILFVIRLFAYAPQWSVYLVTFIQRTYRIIKAKVLTVCIPIFHKSRNSS